MPSCFPRRQTARQGRVEPAAVNVRFFASRGRLVRLSLPPQFNTRLLSGLSSEKAGTSTSNCSPLSLTIW